MSDFGRLQELAREAGVQVRAPVNTAIPYVSPETAVAGETLSCTMGEWSGMSGEPATYAYQWLSDGVEVGTGATYVAAAGSVSCIVTATNSVGPTAAPPSNVVTVTALAATAAARHDAHSDAPARRK